MYLKLTNGTPENYTIGQLRRDNPNTSFPKNIPASILESFGVYSYTQEPQPEFNEKTQKLEDGGFVKGETWTKTWNIVEKTPEEVAEWLEQQGQIARSKRNSLLAETDYLALSDNNMTPEMSAYRQALRDITTQEGFPESISWPTKPE